MNNQSTGWGFFPRYVSWLTIVLALLAIGTFIAVSNPDMRYYPTRMGTGVMESGGGTVPPISVGMPMQDGSAPDRATGMYYPYPYPYPGDVPITDTREFMKVYYNASLLTRDVQALTRRVETTVRGYDGRIDQVSVAPKYGSVSFSVPQVKYEAFRTEVERFVGSRFLTVNISSQNFLPQKVSIEEQQKQADASVADYKAARQRLVAAHTSVVQTLQAQINDPATSAADKASLQQQLVNENASYTKQLSYADTNIKYAQDWQKAVQTQDKTLLANIATVNGTISLQWISLFEMALLYLPGYWIPGIFATLAVLSFLRDRRRSSVLVS
ncbi:MAG: hypothetical protein AAB442_03490 [Patescibacteria group bacterium]